MSCCTDLMCNLLRQDVQDAAELLLPDVSFLVAVKHAKHSDHRPQVASNLQGSHTKTDSKGYTAPLQRP